MLEKIKSFYMSKVVLLINAIGALICWVMWGICCTVNEGQGYLAFYAVTFFLLTGGLILACVGGEINIQKMLFGALLMFMIKENFELMLVNLQYVEEYGVIAAIPSALCFTFAVVIFICHLLQQTDHFGKTVTPVINQFCGIIVVLCFIALTSCRAVIDFSFMIGYIFTYLTVICLETRIHVYKQIRAECRANGTWTDAKRKETKKIFKI